MDRQSSTTSCQSPLTLSNSVLMFLLYNRNPTSLNIGCVSQICTCYIDKSIRLYRCRIAPERWGVDNAVWRSCYSTALLSCKTTLPSAGRTPCFFLRLFISPPLMKPSGGVFSTPALGLWFENCTIRSAFAWAPPILYSYVIASPYWRFVSTPNGFPRIVAFRTISGRLSRIPVRFFLFH